MGWPLHQSGGRLKWPLQGELCWPGARPGAREASGQPSPSVWLFQEPGMNQVVAILLMLLGKENSSGTGPACD